MAATVTDITLESAGVQKPEDETFPWVLTTRWHARLLSTGAPAPVTIQTNLMSSAELVQDDWDNIWSNVTAAYTSIYANSPTISPSNPVSLP